VLAADVTFPARPCSRRRRCWTRPGARRGWSRAAGRGRGIRAAYRKAQHLVAKVGPTRVARSRAVVRIAVPARRGRSKVVAITFTGVTEPSPLWSNRRPPTGVRYDPSESIRRCCGCAITT
jgi:hypothetical protein